MSHVTWNALSYGETVLVPVYNLLVPALLHVSMLLALRLALHFPTIGVRKLAVGAIALLKTVPVTPLWLTVRVTVRC